MLKLSRRQAVLVQHLLKGSSNYNLLFHSADPETSSGMTVWDDGSRRRFAEKLTEDPMKRGANYDLKQY